MSVIQSIQEKYAKGMAIIIALALITFVVMLAFENGGSLFRGSQSNTVGNVNGTSIEYADFQKKVDQTKTYMEQQGYGTGSQLEQQAVDQTWNQEVNRLLMSSEINKLGLQIGKKELGDIMYGANPPQDLKQQFTDKATGQYNAAEAKQRIDEMLKTAKPDQKAQFNAYLDQLELVRLGEKYTSLLTNTTNFPKWMVEKEIADGSQLARISLVREFYTSIPDSSVKITDKEIEDYISKHKKQFKQEESRSIAYVSFSALPTADDSLQASKKVLEFKPGLDSTGNIATYLQAQGVNNYYNGFINGYRLQVPSKDTIIRTPVGQTFGPYVDGTNYSIAKMVAERVQPDSVDVRHILIGLSQTDPETQQQVPVRDTATAYALADSIRKAIAAGANFDSLVVKFSDDQGSKANGGKYLKVESGTMVPQWNDFIFGNPVGSKAVVMTEFGAHYTEILAQKGSSTAYKIAYLHQPIEASSETDAAANNEATKFSGTSRNQKDFDANLEKLKASGHVKAFAQDIAPGASQIQGLGVSRGFVRNIYQAKLGEVLQPERVGDNYVVAVVTEINEKGTQSAAKARLGVEPILRNKKKAEILAKKVGTVTTLEAAASALGGKPIESADSLRITGTSSPLVAGEPKVIGAAFNPANKGKVVNQVIAGNSGIYVIRVDNVTATSIGDANVANQRKTQYEQAKQNRAYPQQALMEAADIRDNRAKVF